MKNARAATERIRVGMVQINNSFENACYVPYSLGMLQAYFQKHSSAAARFSFQPPIYRRIPVQQALEQLEGAQIVAFSVYSWNYRLSLEIARRYKERHPEALIVFGGHHIPRDPSALLNEHPYIDLVCHGEGELPFQRILENYPGRTFHLAPALSFLREGALVSTPALPRIAELPEIPSPYLSGVFDSLFAEDRGHQWIALWETNRGCPFSCTYCDWGALDSSQLYSFDMPRLAAEIDWFAQHQIEFIFCCDSNFGILPRDLEIVSKVAKSKAARGYPKALSVQNTKSADRSYEIQKALAISGLSKGVNLALQSMHPETLRLIGRQNIPAEMFQDLQRRFNRDGIETFSDIIIGLPGETYQSFTQGIARIIDNGQYNRIQFINLSLLPNAPMSEPDYRARCQFTTVETKIVNIHGSPGAAGDEVAESQVLVVGTKEMPPEQWRRARTFSWLASLFFFDKLLQIPLVLLHELRGFSYDSLIEVFMSPHPQRHPILAELAEFFMSEAARIQAGAAEFCHSAQWLNIYWPHDEYAFITLSAGGKLPALYREAELLFQELLESAGKEPLPELGEALELNRALLKHPFQDQAETLETSCALYGFYRGVVAGERVPLGSGRGTVTIDKKSETWGDWETWCREVVWYCNKKGAYMYPARSSCS